MIALLREKIANLREQEYIRINDHNIQIIVAPGLGGPLRYFFPDIPFECESFGLYHALMDDFPEYFPSALKVDLNLLWSTGYDKLKNFYYDAIAKRSAKNIKWGLTYNICRSDDVCVNLVHRSSLEDAVLADAAFENAVVENAVVENGVFIDPYNPISLFEDLKFAYYSGLPLGENIFPAVLMRYTVNSASDVGAVDAVGAVGGSAEEALIILNWLYDTYVELNLQDKISWGENFFENLHPQIKEWLIAKNCPWFHENIYVSVENKKVVKVSSVVYADDFVADRQGQEDRQNGEVQHEREDHQARKIKFIVEDREAREASEAREDHQLREDIIIVELKPIISKKSNEKHLSTAFAAFPVSITAPVSVTTPASTAWLARNCHYEEIKKLYNAGKITHFEPELMNIVTKNGDYAMMYWLYEHGCPMGDQVHLLLTKRGRKF